MTRFIVAVPDSEEAAASDKKVESEDGENTQPAKKQKTEFRNYVDSAAQERVSRFYRQNHELQTVDFVKRKKEQILKLEKKEMSIWEAALMLDELVDDSDPDTDFSQIIHLLQTGESLRQQYPDEEHDWFALTGFIHDLGKVLAHKDLYAEPQWCVVGDTFPVGCQFSEKIIFHEYFDANPDSKNELYNTKFGIYKEGIGLDNVDFSWGHDEYMYQVCIKNKCTLPPEALYVIRFHSFYSGHQHNEYEYLMNEEDKKYFPWVKKFQRHDLYSKLPEKPDVQKLMPYYKSLIAKYFPEKLKW